MSSTFHHSTKEGGNLPAQALRTRRKSPQLDTRGCHLQHRTMQRDKIIADAMGERAMAELRRSGTQRARGNQKSS
jgi:hypothetical protein